MLGYLSAQDALQAGFTHHGDYYGIPIWIALNEDELMVAAKWAPMRPLMEIAGFIEALLCWVLRPNEGRWIQFTMGEPIEKDKSGELQA